MKSDLLAVKQYRPSQDMLGNEHKASKVFYIWAWEIFSKFGLNIKKDILGFSSNGGLDVKRALTQFVSSTHLWGWCIPHLCNTFLLVEPIDEQVLNDQSPLIT